MSELTYTSGVTGQVFDLESNCRGVRPSDCDPANGITR